MWHCTVICVDDDDYNWSEYFIIAIIIICLDRSHIRPLLTLF